jgi:LmbE family N-acetylglucosaminyl deacetylase
VVSFDHRDQGTSNATWLAADAWGETSKLSLDGVTLLVVVAAHPDDETLGAGGLMATAHAAGIPVTVIVATLGEHSHPDSRTVSPNELAALRRVEVVRAIDELAPGSAVHLLGLRDGGLRDQTEPLRRAGIRITPPRATSQRLWPRPRVPSTWSIRSGAGIG